MKQVMSYALVIVLWIVAIVLWASGVFPYLGWFLIALHLAELLLIGFRTGKAYGVGPVKSTLLCMLFGFIWWLPLRRQMKAEQFTDADFLREG